MATSKKLKRNVLVSLRVDQFKGVKRLHEQTRVPMQVYLREAVDDLLRKYREAPK